MTENNLDSPKSVTADIEFTLSNYKPKTLNGIVKIRDSEKVQNSILFSMISREMRPRTSTRIQFKFSSLN